MNLDPSSLSFPVICFYRHLFRVRFSFDSLILTTSAGIKNGMFENMVIIDSDGKEIHVLNAEKKRGIGFLWGYNLFLNQTIEVTLNLKNESSIVTLEYLKGRILKTLSSSHGWQTRDDYSELRSNISDSDSIRSLIELVK